ncbi:MAG: DUF4097 family beta strand repeat protein [Acetatifactor sp.]|nr:DUF4097 family beta strand repeat protein [Acetatifactor sp.]
MKKFMKICAIMAVVMLVLGAALALMAARVRGSAVITQVVDSVTGGRLHVSFGNVGIPWGVFWKDGWHYDLDVSDVYDGSHTILQGDVREYSLGSGVKSLDIEMGGYFFETVVSADDSFYLTTKNADKFQCYVENGVLYLKAVNANMINIGGSNEKRIILSIPKDQFFEEVELELGAGQTILDNLRAEEVSLEVGAGQIIGRNIRVGELGISVGAGQVELPGMNVDVLDVEIGMGELVGSGSIQKSASLECSMGNLELTLTGREQDFNYELEVAAGNLTLGRNSYSGLARERNIQNGADKNMEIECSMGNVTILFHE